MTWPSIERSAAVRLLVARARQLAAAQLRLLPPAALLRRLGSGLDRSLDLAASTVDTPDRQRTRSGRSTATSTRSRYLARLVESVRDALQGPEHRAVSERLDREADEIRSAIDWALQTDDAETVGRLLASLFVYWWSRGPLPMTHELAERAAALPSAAF